VPGTEDQQLPSIWICFGPPFSPCSKGAFRTSSSRETLSKLDLPFPIPQSHSFVVAGHHPNFFTTHFHSFFSQPKEHTHSTKMPAIRSFYTLTVLAACLAQV
jgi:hypothetical protein